MKKFVLKTILCGRRKEKRLEQKAAKGEDEESSFAKGAKKKQKQEKVFHKLDSYCACCLKPFLIERGVRCTECGVRICKNKCSRLERKFCDSWFCLFCYQERTWLLKNMYWLVNNLDDLETKTVWNRGKSSVCKDKLANDTNLMARTAICKLVDCTVDEVCKLSNSERFYSINSDGQRDECEESAIAARNDDHLFKTIIVNKAAVKSRLDQLNKINNDSNVVDNTDSAQIVPYVENCRNNLKSVSQDKWDNEYDQAKCKFSYTSESLSLMIEERIEEVVTVSLDQDVKSNCENCLNFDKSYRVPFPEFGMDIIDSCQIPADEKKNEADDLEYTKIINYVDSWKDNWYFRKKHFKQTSKCVSMFVPNSNTEYRAMIGDKDIEETSDLSEYSINSDEEIEMELLLSNEDESLKLDSNDFNEVSLDDSTEIELTMPKENIFISEEAIKKNFDSRITSSLNDDSETAFSDEKNDEVSKDNISKIKKPIINNETSMIKENIADYRQVIKIEDQRDSEYTEQNIFITEQHPFGVKKSSDNLSCEAKTINGICQTESDIQSQDIDNHLAFDKKNGLTEIQLNTPPKPGSIAEREHKKWENATSIKNNPYSKENIQKRLIEKKYVGPFNLSRFWKDCTIDNPTSFKSEKRESTESVDDVNCHNLNSNNSNQEIKDKTEIIKPNSTMEQDIKLITTNSGKSFNKSNYYIATNIIPIGDEPSVSESTKNNEILEHERKNNKNEIHAKLNNQEQIVDGIDEVVHNKQSLCIENQNRSMRQIDLKLCAFEKNELPKNVSSYKPTEQQVVNKLDIKSLSFLENGILKTQSINKLEDKICKGSGYKSNLVKKQLDNEDSFKKVDIDSDYLLSSKTKNNVILNKDISDTNSLKNTPSNEFSIVNNEQIIDNKLIQYENENEYQETVASKKFYKNKDLKDGKKSEKNDVKKLDYLYNASKTSQTKNSENISSNSEVNCTSNKFHKKLSMPSVKKLVQVFDKKPQEKIDSNLKVETTSNELKENKGVKFQQINVNQLPRQLHSLTARSLSKEFREGLRQIPNKKENFK